MKTGLVIKCDWCKKPTHIKKGYYIGKIETGGKEWFICQECNLKHNVI